jgi:hypothetical protein
VLLIAGWHQLVFEGLETFQGLMALLINVL